MNRMEKQKRKQVDNLALFCLEAISDIEDEPLTLNPLPHNQIMNLISTFLKEKFSISFYNDFMNNLFQGEEVELYFNESEIEQLEFQLSTLKQKRNCHKISAQFYEKEIQKIQKRLLQAKKHSINESYILAPQNNLPGIIYLDITETIEDAFNILHEVIHRMYLEANPSDYSLDELPSIWMEWKLYQYCLGEETYKEEAAKHFKKNIRMILEYSKSIMICSIVRKTYDTTGEISENICENVLALKNYNIKRYLKKEFQEIAWMIKNEPSYIYNEELKYENYLQAYYYGYLLSKNPNANQTLETIIKEVYHNEMALQRQITKAVRNTEMLESFKRELKKIEEN